MRDRSRRGRYAVALLTAGVCLATAATVAMHAPADPGFDEGDSVPSTRRGAHYLLTGWIRAAESPGEVSLRLVERDATGQPLGQAVASFADGQMTDDQVTTQWRQVSVPYTARHDGSRLTPEVTGSSAVDVDEISITEAPVAAQQPCVVDEALVPSCGAWWGIYSIKGESLTKSVTDLERRLDRTFDLVLRYHDFSGRPGPGQFPDASEIELGESRLLFFAWESRLFAGNKELRWSEIAAGVHDEVVRQAADRLRDYGKKVFVAFDPEMDRRTTGQEIDKGSTSEYVAAARRVHQIFEESRADNVVWVWTVTGYLGEGNDQRMAQMYPGDHYVDWVAFDPYNFYGCKGSAWETFEQSMSGTYEWLVDRGLGHKPFMIPEYGTQFDPADPARAHRWYTDIPATLARYPNLKGLVRWDSDFGCGLNLDNGPGMIEAFATAGRHPLVNPPR